MLVKKEANLMRSLTVRIIVDILLRHVLLFTLFI